MCPRPGAERDWGPQGPGAGAWPGRRGALLAATCNTGTENCNYSDNSGDLSSCCLDISCVSLMTHGYASLVSKLPADNTLLMTPAKDELKRYYKLTTLIIETRSRLSH